MNSEFLQAEQLFKEYIERYQFQEAEEYITSFISSIDWNNHDSNVYCTFLLYQYDACYRQSYYSKSSLISETLQGLLSVHEHSLSNVNIGKVYLAIAQSSAVSMDIEKAEQSIEQALERFSEDSEFKYRANAFFTKGSLYKIQGDYTNSEEIYIQAMNLLDESSEYSMLANGYVFIGMLKFEQSYFDQAFSMYHKALSLYEKDDNMYGKSAVLSNLGNIYRRLSDNQKALEYYQKSLELNQTLNRQSGIANVYTSMGNVYFNLQDYEKAALYYRNSIEIYERLGNRTALYSIYNNVGSTYLMNKQYEDAIEYYNRAYERYRNTGNYIEELQYYNNMGYLHLQQKNYGLAKEYNEKGLAICNEKGDIDRMHGILGMLGRIYYDENEQFRNSEIAISYVQQAYEYTKQANMKYEQAGHAKQLSEMYSQLKDWESAFTFHKIFHDLESEIQSSDIRKQAEIMEHNRKILEAEHHQKSELSALREHSKLLHEILPSTIADRIVNGEKSIAEETSSVSIFFSDIVGFTSIAESLEPSQLVYYLNELFSAIDNLAHKHGIEKIKTIGDSYMAVCGIPEHKADHAVRMESFARDVVALSENFDFMGKRIELRIGIHAGSVVAGVIGLNRYSYDLWGDAVNIASRLESTGIPGKIQVSNSFIEEYQKQALCSPQTEFRGETVMKGKGSMRTYLLV